MQLPVEFTEQLRAVIGEDTDRYFAMYNDPPFRGISINRLKTTPEKLLPLLDIPTRQSPFYKDSYYIQSEVEGLGNTPLHMAGGFYIQEPSAASAVSLLEISEGDHVLDLCAAPGGKSAQIASLLGGSGLIWSNEPVRSRAMILLSNHERMGISNGVVSSAYPDVLCPALEGCFDKVLVDAPCSGEGMFRKNPDAVKEWSIEHTAACALRQLAILKSAAQALRAGGTLVYSTCTFNAEENERTVERFLAECPEFEAYAIEDPFGRATEFDNAVRITPLEGGEGHFAARFRKKGNESRRPFRSGRPVSMPRQQKDIAKRFLEDIFLEMPEMTPEFRGKDLMLYPAVLSGIKAPGIIRCGVLAGELIRDRIEPAHALFVTSRPEQLRRVMELPPDSAELNEFLSGMEIGCTGAPGYTAVSTAGMILGFGKCSTSRLKNKYPKGLRCQLA